MTGKKFSRMPRRLRGRPPRPRGWNRNTRRGDGTSWSEILQRAGELRPASGCRRFAAGVIFVGPSPGAHAPGYVNAAASRLMPPDCRRMSLEARRSWRRSSALPPRSLVGTSEAPSEQRVPLITTSQPRPHLHSGCEVVISGTDASYILALPHIDARHRSRYQRI